MKAAIQLHSSPCQTISSALDTYLDGELSPPQIVEVESHLAQCTNCRERVALDRAMRSSIKSVAHLRAPLSLRERMRSVMVSERAIQEQLFTSAGLPAQPRCRNELATVLPFRRPSHVTPAINRGCLKAPAPRIVSLAERRALKPLRARYAVPFAVAAGVAFAVSVHSPRPLAPPPTEVKAAASPQPDLGLDGIVNELVSLHAQPLPPEVTQPDEVRRFDPFVGVPVEPPKLQRFGAKWVGGRMLPIQSSRAAVLQYSMAGGHRISVYVYDPRQVRPESSTLRQRVVRDAPVYVGNIRGYNVAATEHRGIGYAVATDLDEPESVELVAATAAY